jgi:hypothetical protein
LAPQIVNPSSALLANGVVIVEDDSLTWVHG